MAEESNVMVNRTFQKPDQIIMQKASDQEGTFEFGPLERGYGVTIGNALRRTLLSSLEGFAITNINITGIDHEFSSINGVKEDVVEVILNLKQIRLKQVGEEEEETLQVKTNGQEQITGADISKESNNFQVLNPDKVLANIEPSISFEIEVKIEKGRGFVVAEDNKPEDAPIGQIPIDASFSPIRRVKFSVEDTRVGQTTDYENLLLTIVTDGSILPQEALKAASGILIEHLALFSDENITINEEVKEDDEQVDEDYLHMRKLLKTSLTDLNLSVRAFNCLKAADIQTLGDLVNHDVADLLKFRNFGKKSLAELEEIVREKGLTFGMDVSKYNLDED
jgi:DNA-directed RNA polymerase subunit alpha